MGPLFDVDRVRTESASQPDEHRSLVALAEAPAIPAGSGVYLMASYATWVSGVRTRAWFFTEVPSRLISIERMALLLFDGRHRIGKKNFQSWRRLEAHHNYRYHNR